LATLTSNVVLPAPKIDTPGLDGFSLLCPDPPIDSLPSLLSRLVRSSSPRPRAALTPNCAKLLWPGCVWNPRGVRGGPPPFDDPDPLPPRSSTPALGVVGLIGGVEPKPNSSFPRLLLFPLPLPAPAPAGSSSFPCPPDIRDSRDGRDEEA
jgi:hypothetical protein